MLAAAHRRAAGRDDPPGLRISKAVIVLPEHEHLGYATSWDEARLIVGMAGYKVKPPVRDPIGTEGPRSFFVDADRIEPLPEC